MSGLRSPEARTIEKPRRYAVTPNLLDYEATRASFSWEAARAELSGLPGGRGLNIAYEAVDRHARGPAPRPLAEFRKLLARRRPPTPVVRLARPVPGRSRSAGRSIRPRSVRPKTAAAS